MKRKTYFTIISLILVAIFVTLGVFIAQTKATRRSIEVTFIVKSQQKGFEFWELVCKGAQEAAKEFNVDLTIDGPMTEEDTQGQINIVERAINTKPDVIILAAVDQEKLLPAAKEIKKQGIKLIVVDSNLSEKVENCFVGTDNYSAAQGVGDAMGKAMDGKGTIAVIAHQKNTSTSVQRIQGFQYAIKNFPDIRILGPYDIGDSVEKSRETTLQVLAENPDITGIFATNQISAEGVTQALKEAGKNNIKFFAFDSSTVQNAALENGIVDGFAVQKPFNMGYMGVKAAVEAYTGTLRKTNIDTGFEFATKENMREEKIQKLLYPFV
jgi:ribose transport system substrate-binding protein